MTVGCVCRMVEFPVRSPAGNPGNLRDNRCALAVLELSYVLKEEKRQGAKKSEVSTAVQMSLFDACIEERKTKHINHVMQTLLYGTWGKNLHQFTGNWDR